MIGMIEVVVIITLKMIMFVIVKVMIAESYWELNKSNCDSINYTKWKVVIY